MKTYNPKRAANVERKAWFFLALGKVAWYFLKC